MNHFCYSTKWKNRFQTLLNIWSNHMYNLYKFKGSLQETTYCTMNISFYKQYPTTEGNFVPLKGRIKKLEKLVHLRSSRYNHSPSYVQYDRETLSNVSWRSEFTLFLHGLANFNITSNNYLSWIKKNEWCVTKSNNDQSISSTQYSIH